MLLPSDNSSWPNTYTPSDGPQSDWYPNCSTTPSLQAVKFKHRPYAQQHGPDSQTDPGPQPDLFSLVPPLHSQVPLLPCPDKRPSPPLDNPPAFGSGCSTDFSCIPIPNSIPDGVPSTDLRGFSRFPVTPNTAPRIDPTTVHPIHILPLPWSAYPLSFGDFPMMSDIPLYSAQPQSAVMQGQNGNMSVSQQHQSSPAHSEARSVFDRLQHTPVQQQQASSSTPQQHRSQTPGHPNDPQPPHDLPPGFASPEGPLPGAGDFPPGFKSPRSTSASHSAARSRMRSDQMAAPAQPEQPISRSAHSAQAAPDQGGPPGVQGGSPGGPPGFGGLPAYLAQRLSPSPAQKPAELPDQAAPHRPMATSSSPEYGNNPGQKSRQHLPAGVYDASSDDLSDEEPPGFARADNTAGQHGQAPASKPSSPEPGRQPPRQVQREGPPGYGSGNTAPNDNNGVTQVHIYSTICSCLQPAFVFNTWQSLWQSSLHGVPASAYLHMMRLMDLWLPVCQNQGWWTLVSCRQQLGTRACCLFPLFTAPHNSF